MQRLSQAVASHRRGHALGGCGAGGSVAAIGVDRRRATTGFGADLPARERAVLRSAAHPARGGVLLATIDLGPLREQDVEAMVGHLARLPETALRQCIDRAGGNPLFSNNSCAMLRNGRRSAALAARADRARVIAWERLTGSRFAPRQCWDSASIRRRFRRWSAILPMTRPACFGAAAARRRNRADFRRCADPRGDFALAARRGAAQAAPRGADWFDGRDPMLARRISIAPSPLPRSTLTVWRPRTACSATVPPKRCRWSSVGWRWPRRRIAVGRRCC